MYKKLQRKASAGFMAFAIILSNVIFPVASAFAKEKPFYDTPTNGEITICHRTNSVTNPYEQITISVEAADGLSDNNGNGANADHYSEHKGLVFDVTADPDIAYPTPRNGDQWGDIIPPVLPNSTISGANISGLNWNEAGKAIYYNGCSLPTKDAAAAVVVAAATCKSAGIATVTIQTNATLTSNGGVLDQTVGSHTAVFTATTGHLFADGQVTLEVPYIIAAQLTGDECEEQPDDDRETRTITNTPVCLPLGHGTVSGYTEERTRSYTLVSGVWTAGEWSAWTKVAGTDTSRPATTEECPPIVVTPEVPERYDFCYGDSDYILLPNTVGVIYKVNGVVESGSVQYEGTDLVVTAEAAEGYVLTEGAQTTWTYDEDDFTDEKCLTITKSAKVATDTNKDGKITLGDTITWEITIKNTSAQDLEQVFYVEIEDENATLEDDGKIGYLGAGQTVKLTATSIVTSAQANVCKATNTANFAGWRASLRSLVANESDIADESDDSPLAIGSAPAEYVLDCGKGGLTPSETPKTPETPSTPVITSASEVPVVLPYTSGMSALTIALSALSLASIVLVAGAAVRSRLFAS